MGISVPSITAALGWKRERNHVVDVFELYMIQHYVSPAFLGMYNVISNRLAGYLSKQFPVTQMLSCMKNLQEAAAAHQLPDTCVRAFLWDVSAVFLTPLFSLLVCFLK